MANEGDTRKWLAEQGLAKYAEAFSNNAIGLDVLPELTDANLKNIGVAALGDRLDGIPKVISERRCGHAKQVRRSDVPQFQSDVDARPFG
jgi:SAM domain (Sterile alpha motif)